MRGSGLVTENTINRRWTINNNLNDRHAGAHRPPYAGTEALLYYQRQLEAELDEVRRLIREAAPPR